MIKRVLIFALTIQGITGIIQADSRNFLLEKTQPQHIFINNRILAQVNGKPISVIDLMKKMDLVFFRQYPQYSSSIEARHQFYNMSWKHVLNEMIEKELIMADAAEVKVEISNGDVRQEMENMFGPNIIANLDKAGLSYDEASKIIKEDLLLKRMMMMRVNAIAARSVTPQDVRVAYQDYAKENATPDAWRYRVVSIKGKDPRACAEAANFAYQLVTEDKISIDELENKVRGHAIEGETADCSISEEYLRTNKDISESHRQVLASMTSGTYSHPIVQEGRTKDSKIFRIFYLNKFTQGGAPTLPEVEAKIKGQLIDKKINTEGDLYLAKLRAHFDIQGGPDSLPENFQPFILK